VLRSKSARRQISGDSTPKSRPSDKAKEIVMSHLAATTTRGINARTSQASPTNAAECRRRRLSLIRAANRKERKTGYRVDPSAIACAKRVIREVQVSFDR
jgi:hypothetical protein